MSKFKLELNSDGVKALLQSAEMQSGLETLANDILSRCGEGYDMRSTVAETRAVVTIATATEDAMKDNLDNNTLLNAL